MGVMLVTDDSDARIIVRRIVFPLLVGLALGFGMDQLPEPANLIAVFAFAAGGLVYSVWAYVDIRKRMRRLLEMQREAEEYIASYERHPRVP